MSISFADFAVLLVEPSPLQARIIGDALTELGVARLATVESGGAALEKMRDLPPSLIASAFYLPDMTGVELIETMRGEEALAHLPFVLVSSETRPQVLDPVRQSGACAILPKPFALPQLAAALSAAANLIEPRDMLSFDGDIEQLRILMVDDSANARRFIRRVLENLGIEQIIEAASGAEAVSILAETMVDLVITDYHMPEMDGHALTTYIRQQSWQSSLPILMVTSESDESRLAAVEQAGVSAICDKPFDAQTVKRLIEQALASRDG